MNHSSAEVVLYSIRIFFIVDYDMATQRMCVQRGPSDSEDRCAYTVYNYKKVYMCFCQGDLCNGDSRMSTNAAMMAATVISVLVTVLRFH